MFYIDASAVDMPGWNYADILYLLSG